MYASKRLQEEAYDYLKDLIINEKLEDNLIYSEAKIASSIGMSRTPVRDALQRLAQDKFIDILPSKGFRPHKITENDIIETYQMRSAIEGYCALLITQQCHTAKADEVLLRLKFNIEKQKKILFSTANLEEFLDVDIAFHTLIVEFSENNAFISMFNSYVNIIKRLARHSLLHKGRMKSTFNEHLDIYTAMSNGNLSNIYHTTLVHMETPKFMNLEDICSKS